MKQTQQKTLFWCLQVLAAGCLGLSQAPVAMAAGPEAPSLVVTTTSDTTAADGQTTLREAVAYARSLPTSQKPTVTFAPGVTGTITLGGSNIDISRPSGSKLTISGPGASVLSINGNAQSNIFYADGMGNGVISGLTLTNGLARSGGAINAVPNAINEEYSGKLEIIDCVFNNNRATFEAGAVNGGCVVHLLRCSFINNRSDNYQGAVQFYSYPEFIPSGATDCVFSGNTAKGLGGAVAVYGDGTTFFTNCVFNNNSTTGTSYNQGGALQIDTDLADYVTLNNCTFENNTSSGQGGAINLTICASLTLTNTKVSNNHANIGGGVSVTKAFWIDFIRSALTDNTSSGNGGGIYTESLLNFTNSTVSGNNSNGSGGGVYLNSTQSATKLSLQFTTVTANSATNGGGVFLGDNRTGNIARSIVAGNTAATNSDVRGTFVSGDFNVIGKVGSATGFLSSDRVGTNAAPLDAGLDVLTNNGGPTPTHALLAGSPALDLATPVTSITTDQRGVVRPTSGKVDAGAFESSLVLPALALDLNGNSAGTALTTNFTEQTPLVVAPDLLITGVSTVNSASVQLNENPDNALETLSAVVAGTQITASYNAATRTLTLSGADTLQQYRQVLASVTYNDLSDTPNTANRTLIFSISSAGQSQSATATLQVLAVNDAPLALLTIDGNGQVVAQTTIKDTPLTLSSAGNNPISIADVDAGSALEQVQLSVQYGTLTLNGTSGLTFSQGNGSNNATQTFQGTVTAINQALNGIVYTPTASFTGTDTLTFNVNDLGHTGQGGPLSNTASLTINVLPPVASTGAIISEFRLRGTNGSADEYIEIANLTNAPLNISGWSLIYDGAATPFVLPANTVLPTYGHYLLAGSTYSLGGNATANQILSSDIPDNSGLHLRNASGAVRDAIAFTGSILAGEGTPLPIAPSTNGEYAFVRDEVTDFPQDTNNNAVDFNFIATNAGIYNNLQAQLGAPSPSNLLSPRVMPGKLNFTTLDPTTSEFLPPNRVRDSSATGPNATLGTLLFRRKITNSTGKTITRLRVRSVRQTTLGSPRFNPSPVQAEIRLLSCSGGSVLSRDEQTLLHYQGTTLETTPAQPLAGGLNSAVECVTTVTLPGGLAPGASQNFQFTYGVMAPGGFTAIINIEGAE